MIALLALVLAVSTHPAEPPQWVDVPAENIAPRSFLCSRGKDQLSYIVFARTADRNFVTFWEKQAGVPLKGDELSLTVRGKTAFSRIGDERFLIAADDGQEGIIRLEMMQDKEFGLRGNYVASVKGKISKGECYLTAMLPGFEDFK
jgi:hypothetical protein